MTMELERRVERLETDMSELKEIVRQNALAIAQLTATSEASDRRIETLTASTQETGEQVRNLTFEVQRVLAQVGEATARNTAAVDSLAASVRASNQRQDVAFQVIQEMQSEVRDMQSEVRGLQTENRRILDRMEQHFSDGHGAA